MPGPEYSHNGSRKGSRRRRNLFDRLLSRKKRRVRSSSSFPGINLPVDYDPSVGMKMTDENLVPRRVKGQKKKKSDKNIIRNLSERLHHFFKKPFRKKTRSRRRSLSQSFKLYLQKRALRKEERLKQRIKRKLRREHIKKFRKQEAGRPLKQKLFTFSSKDKQADQSKKIAFFSQKSNFYRSLTIVVNSLSIFMATYVLVYLFYWLTSMLVASWYGLDSILYYYDLKFNDHSDLWNRFNILMVTGTPPFLCLILGTMLFRVVFKKERFVGLQKLFILWSSFHLLNHFFGAFPSGIVTSEGFGYVAAWMYMNTAFRFMFSLVSLLLLGIIGYFSAQHILETSDSLTRIKPENKTAFMFYQMTLPWLIGTMIMLLIRLPEGFNYPYETLMFFSMIFLVIPPFFNAKVKPKLNLVRVKKKRHIQIGYLVMMLVLIAFLRIMLGIGLHFIIEINISISPATI